MGLWDVVKMIIPGLIGFAIGWLLSALRGGISAEERESWEAKIRGYDRDLDVARVDLRSHKDQIAALKSELSGSNNTIKARDRELADLQTKLDGLASIETELSSKTSEVASLDGEIRTLKSKFTRAETEAAAAINKSIESEAKVAAELETLKKNLTNKDDEINALLARVKEMAPLGLQLKDRELKLKEWETKHHEALGLKDDEIAKLNSKHEAALKAKDVEFAELQARVGEFESPESKIAELESKLQATESGQAAVLRDKDSAILLLQLRVKELEPLPGQLAERDLRIRILEAKLESTTDEKNGELEILRTRVGELEGSLDPLRAQLSDRDLRLAQLESDLQSITSEKDQELDQLRVRVRDLEEVETQLADRDRRINDFQALISNREAEIAELRSTNGGGGEIGTLRTQVNDLTVQLRDAQTKMGEIGSSGESQPEIAALRQRISDLETMYTRVLHPPAKAEWDDLRLINGVGPVLEKMLHKLGIYTFKQMGLWNDEQIDWVDSQLENFHGRIRRENWVEAAKDEYLKKYNEKLN